MPTILRDQGFRFFFFSNEGQEPPHVHVEKGDGIVKVWLLPVRLDYAHRLSAQDVRRILKLVTEHETAFIERWNEHFGR